MDRHRVARRLALLMKLLDGRRHMPALIPLAAQLGCCKRTLCRDLAALEEAGWALPTRAHDYREVA